METVDSRLRSNITAWLEGDDRDPTAVQQSLIRKAPAILDSIFTRLREREPVDDLVKQLEEIQQAIVESNNIVSFVESDHGLGLDVIRTIVRTLEKASERDFEGKLEEARWKYVLYLDSQGWKSLVDDTPALELKTKKHETKLLSERPKKKLIEYRVPVDIELDEQIAFPKADEADGNDDEDGEDVPQRTGRENGGSNRQHVWREGRRCSIPGGRRAQQRARRSRVITRAAGLEAIERDIRASAGALFQCT